MDLDFLLTCKREKLIPTFARPKLSIGGDGRLRSKVAKLIIGTEIRNKHAKKKLLRKEINEIRKKLESELGLLTFYSLKYRISKEVEAKKQNWSSTHEKNWETLGRDKKKLKLLGEGRRQSLYRQSSIIFRPMCSRMKKFKFFQRLWIITSLQPIAEANAPKSNLKDFTTKFFLMQQI